MNSNTNIQLINLNFEGQEYENLDLTTRELSNLSQKLFFSFQSDSTPETNNVTEQNESAVEISTTIFNQPENNSETLTLSPVLASALTSDNLAEIQPLGQVTSLTDDIPYITPQTNLSSALIKLNNFRADSRFQNIDGRGVAVVIIDTGIDLNHPFFGPDNNGDGVADRIVYSYDFADNDADASDTSTHNGHGSNVSSIIGSSDSQYTGIAPGVNIIHLKVFQDAGSGNFSIMQRALQWVVNNVENYNIVSVNMSISDNANHRTPQQLYSISDEIAALAAQDVALVAAAGNKFYSFSSQEGLGYPAADPNAIAVGATFDANVGRIAYGATAIANTTAAGRIAPFSQRHGTLSPLFAPGAPITGANWRGGTVTMHGTSQAAPQVSGAIALAQQLALQELGRRLTIAEIRNLLVSTGTTINDGDDEDDNVVNTGKDFKLLNIVALGEAILNMAGPSPVVISLNGANISHLEGNSGLISYQFPVNLDRASDQTITINYSTNNDTATVANNDYVDNDGTLTFNPGQTSQTITVYVNGDTAFETDETFSVRLNSVSNGVLDSLHSQSTGTILNDDSEPVLVSLTPATLNLNEGNGGTNFSTLTVTLDRPSEEVVTVSFETEDGTATVADGDYNSGSGIVTFNPGQTSQTLSFSINGDNKVELNEYFFVQLNNASNATINSSRQSSRVVLYNDDRPIVSLMPFTLSSLEGNGRTVPYTFTVTLDRPSTGVITVNYVTNDGTATVADNDYIDNEGILTFAAGQTSQTITVNVKGDTTVETDEDFSVLLVHANNATLNSASQQSTGVIINDDRPIVSLTPSTLILAEDNSGQVAYTFTATLDQPSHQEVTVNYSTNNGTATVGNNDYIDNDGTITFTPGQTVQTITVYGNGDTAIETDEHFVVRLNGASNATINTKSRQGTGVILNDDSPIVSLVPATIRLDEGNEGTVAYIFSVNLDRTSNQEITIDYSTNDGTATVADNDYIDNDGILTFAPGQTSQTITVLVNGDTAIEFHENFSVRLDSATNVAINPQNRQGTGTIFNDDSPIVAISPLTIRHSEGNEGMIAYNFAINLSLASDQEITVNYSTNDGTATVADNDYIDNDGILTFAPGHTSQMITVLVNGDTAIETGERFTVRLNSATNVAINPQNQQGTGIILNDDLLAPSSLSSPVNDGIVQPMNLLGTSSHFSESLDIWSQIEQITPFDSFNQAQVL